MLEETLLLNFFSGFLCFWTQQHCTCAEVLFGTDVMHMQMNKWIGLQIELSESKIRLDLFSLKLSPVKKKKKKSLFTSLAQAMLNDSHAIVAFCCVLKSPGITMSNNNDYACLYAFPILKAATLIPDLLLLHSSTVLGQIWEQRDEAALFCLHCSRLSIHVFQSERPLLVKQTILYVCRMPWLPKRGATAGLTQSIYEIVHKNCLRFLYCMWNNSHNFSWCLKCMIQHEL